VSRHGFLRWFGWSAAAHLALGASIWIGLPRIEPASLPGSGAVVTLVELVDAPTDHRAVPQAPRSARPAARPLAPAETEPLAATADQSRSDPISDASFPAPIPAEPDVQVSRSDAAPDSTDNALPPLPLPDASVQASNDHGTVLAELAADAGMPTDSYRPLVLAMLERAKRYPLLAQRRGLEGTVEIAFVIHADGRLSDPEVIASSTHHMLDDAALATVRRLRSVPPPPSQIPVRFPARIQYRLDP
jgi:protein TonB